MGVIFQDLFFSARLVKMKSSQLSLKCKSQNQVINFNKIFEYMMQIECFIRLKWALKKSPFHKEVQSIE